MIDPRPFWGDARSLTVRETNDVAGRAATDAACALAADGTLIATLTTAFRVRGQVDTLTTTHASTGGTAADAFRQPKTPVGFAGMKQAGLPLRARERFLRSNIDEVSVFARATRNTGASQVPPNVKRSKACADLSLGTRLRGRAGRVPCRPDDGAVGTFRVLS